MAIRVSSKVSKSTKSEQGSSAAKAVVKLVQVPSQVIQLMTSTANAWSGAEIAATSREQTIVKLGQVIGNTMGRNPREVTKASIAAPLAKAYREANAKLPAERRKDEKALDLYVGQQRSRILNIAYPGGADADPQTAKRAAADLAKAISANLKQDEIHGVASGRLGYKAGKLVEIKQHTRGGGNKVKPLDAFRKGLKELLSAAKSAKLSKQQMAVGIHDVGVTDLEIWDDAEDFADCIGK
jgi:hypothetical protein